MGQHNLLDFFNMNILVTGAGSGIGEGIAHGLAQAGHTVVVTDVAREPAEAVAEAIRQQGGQAHALALNVTDQAQIDGLVDALDAEGIAGVDVLINNAGLQHVSPLESFEMDRWSHLVDVMLTGAAAVTRALLPGMRARGFGRIMHIGSIHSVVGSPFKSAYVAAKHGLVGFSKVIALETADTDITINTVCPTYVKTPLVDQQIKAQAEAHGISEQAVIDTIMLKPMPKGVFISFEELSGICAFLLSPAARNITGQAIVVDGGWTAQ